MGQGALEEREREPSQGVDAGIQGFQVSFIGIPGSRVPLQQGMHLEVQHKAPKALNPNVGLVGLHGFGILGVPEPSINLKPTSTFVTRIAEPGTQIQSHQHTETWIEPETQVEFSSNPVPRSPNLTITKISKPTALNPKSCSRKPKLLIGS